MSLGAASESLSQTQSAIPWPNRSYAWYVVVILTVAFSFAIVDRVALGLLVQPIERDLGITDAQMGLLQGLAFGIFYSTLVIPIGFIADRRSRRWIITIGIVFWSIATMACGAATGFLSLFFARIGIGAGEATLNPAGGPLIADYFPPYLRSRAFSLFFLGSTAGTGLSYVVSGAVIKLAQWLQHAGPGWLSGIPDWKIVFLLIGVPGLLIAPIFILTVREPIRRDRLVRTTTVQGRQLVPLLKQNWGAYTSVILGASLNLLAIYTILAWFPTFYIRYHHWSGAEIGAALGAFGTPAGFVSGLTGGVFIAWLEKAGRKDAVMIILALATMAFAIFGSAACLVNSPAMGIALYCGFGVTATWVSISALTGLNQITPNELRSKVIAIYTLSYGVLSLGIGPYVVGLLSDRVFHGPRGIGLALATALVVSGIIGLSIILAGRKPFRDARARAAAWTEEG